MQMVYTYLHKCILRSHTYTQAHLHTCNEYTLKYIHIHTVRCRFRFISH